MGTVSVQVAPLQIELLTRLKTLEPRGINVVDGYVGQGEDIGRQDDGVSFIPTVVLEMGSLGRVLRGEGIALPSADLKSLGFTVLAIAGSALQVTQAIDAVVAKLEDYQPQNCSVITVVGGGFPGSPVATFLNPLRFARSIGFNLSVEPSVVP